MHARKCMVHVLQPTQDLVLQSYWKSRPRRKSSWPSGTRPSPTTCGPCAAGGPAPGATAEAGGPPSSNWPVELESGPCPGAGCWPGRGLRERLPHGVQRLVDPWRADDVDADASRGLQRGRAGKPLVPLRRACMSVPPGAYRLGEGVGRWFRAARRWRRADGLRSAGRAVMQQGCKLAPPAFPSATPARCRPREIPSTSSLGNTSPRPYTLREPLGA